MPTIVDVSVWGPLIEPQTVSDATYSLIGLCHRSTQVHSPNAEVSFLQACPAYQNGIYP